MRTGTLRAERPRYEDQGCGMIRVLSAGSTGSEYSAAVTVPRAIKYSANDCWYEMPTVVKS